jgi:hypothetical protein
MTTLSRNNEIAFQRRDVLLESVLGEYTGFSGYF